MQQAKSRQLLVGHLVLKNYRKLFRNNSVKPWVVRRLRGRRNLTCPWYGIFFMKEFGFMGMVFDNFCIFQIYGYDVQKIFRICGHTLEKFLQNYRWCFYDFNGIACIVKNSNEPPPPTALMLLRMNVRFFSGSFRCFLHLNIPTQKQAARGGGTIQHNQGV